MEYTKELVINLPREQVIALFNDEDNLKKWQPGLQSMNLIKGEKGQVGAESELVYKMGKRTLAMKETILEMNPPETLKFKYDANKVENWMTNTFIDHGDTTTWVTHNIFKCKGMIKIFALLSPGSFKKQTEKSMMDFKKFAENA